MVSLNALSIDVEDWFHILDIGSSVSLDQWGRMENRVVSNTLDLLDILSEHGEVKCTFFVLGWVAERYPDLIREIKQRGHEIASHGYAHVLAYQQNQSEFRDDVRKSRSIIERVAQVEVIGYRVPGFSIRDENLWAIDVLHDEGFLYDSSIFPARRGHGGMNSAPIYPYQYENGLWEFPISVVEISRLRVPFSGGGYFRLLPYYMIRRFMKKINAGGHPVVVYLHPRDIDAGQPRLPMPINRSLKCYVNLHSAKMKLCKMLDEFSFAPVCEVFQGYGGFSPYLD